MGLMQQQPLLISGLIEHVAMHHGNVEIISHVSDTGIYRSTWRNVRNRAKRLANALTTLGVQSGQRIATLAWNTHRHLEFYFAVSGMGAVSHTVNPRLFAEQITYIINHAADEYVFFDLGFADQLVAFDGRVHAAPRWFLRPKKTQPFQRVPVMARAMADSDL